MSQNTKQTPMMVRMFGLFGLILAVGYFVEGVLFIRAVLHTLARQQYTNFLWWLAVVSLDLVIAAVLTVAAVGLLLVQTWAKKTWLAATTALTLLHLILTTLHHLGRGVSTFFLIWTWMVLIVTALSWWYFTRQPSAAPLTSSPSS